MTPAKLTNSEAHPIPIPQKWTIDLLFKKYTIHKHVKYFKTPSPPFDMDVINGWSLNMNA